MAEVCLGSPVDKYMVTTLELNCYESAVVKIGSDGHLCLYIYISFIQRQRGVDCPNDKDCDNGREVNWHNWHKSIQGLLPRWQRTKLGSMIPQD